MIVPALISLAERAPTPDALARPAMRAMVADTAARLARTQGRGEPDFVADMRRHPIATHVEAANAQHYEVPAAFFEIVLGPRRKYSCCLFEPSVASLAEAEEAALAASVARAGIENGMRILELGCGWGSLTLYMAERFPGSRIVAVSNSASQRDAIRAQALRKGLGNIDVLTADMNDFDIGGRFDRIVSVEMFEHMSNWRALLARCRGWLERDGRLFLHVFTHAHASYRFDHADRSNWIAQHFFTGGVMPAHDLPARFPDLFGIEAQWRWSGEHYARTAREWLARFDANRDRVEAILRPVYGRDTRVWMRRWRWFFLATESLFGHAGGEVWGVGHYRLRPAP